MKQIKIFLLFLLSAILIGGCVTVPAFKSGIVTRDYMIGLLPISTDIFIFIDFNETEKENLLTQAIALGIAQNEEIGDFIRDCDIDPGQDLYSIAIAVSDFKPDTESGEGAVIINMEYNRDLIIQRMLKDGYSEIGDSPYKVPVYTTHEYPREFQVAFLSDNLILHGSELSTGIVLDQHYKKVKDNTIEPLISTLDEVSRDAPLLAGMRNLSKYMESAVEANPIMNLFTNINEIGVSMNYTQTKLLGEMILIVEDEEQLDTLHVLLKLTLQSTDNIEDERVREIIQHMTLSKEKTGIKFTIEIPIITILTLFNEYQGSFI